MSRSVTHDVYINKGKINSQHDEDILLLIITKRKKEEEEEAHPLEK